MKDPNSAREIKTPVMVREKTLAKVTTAAMIRDKTATTVATAAASGTVAITATVFAIWTVVAMA